MAGQRACCVVGFILAVASSALAAPFLREVRNKRQVAGFAINTGSGTSGQGSEASSSSSTASSSTSTTTWAPFEFQRGRPNFGPGPNAPGSSPSSSVFNLADLFSGGMGAQAGAGVGPGSGAMTNLPRVRPVPSPFGGLPIGGLGSRPGGLLNGGAGNLPGGLLNGMPNGLLNPGMGLAGSNNGVPGTNPGPGFFNPAGPALGPQVPGAASGSSSLGGIMGRIPGLPSFLGNMDAGQLVAKVAELNSQGRLGQYVGIAEMFLGLPRGQGSELDRVNAIIDAVVSEPQQAANLKAQVTSAINTGVVPTSPAGNPSTSAGPLSMMNPSANPDFRILAPGPDLSMIPGIGLPETGLPGSGLPGSGLPLSGLPGSGLPGSRLPGSRLPGSGLSGTGLPGSGFPGAGLPGNGLPGNGVGPMGQNGGADGLPSVLVSDQWQLGGRGLQGLLGMQGNRGGNSGSPLGDIISALGGGGRREVSLGDLLGLNGGQSGLGSVVGQSPEGREAQRIFGLIGDVARFIFGGGSSQGPNQNGLLGLLSRLGVNIGGQGGNQGGQTAGQGGQTAGQGGLRGQGGLGGLGDLLSLLG